MIQVGSLITAKYICVGSLGLVLEVQSAKLIILWDNGNIGWRRNSEVIEV